MSQHPAEPQASEPPRGGDANGAAAHEQRVSMRGAKEAARTWTMVALAVMITLFAVLNRREVRVEWLVGSGNAPLIVVIVISLLVGILITYIATRRPGRRAR